MHTSFTIKLYFNGIELIHMYTTNYLIELPRKFYSLYKISFHQHCSHNNNNNSCSLLNFMRKDQREREDMHGGTKLDEGMLENH